MLSVIVELKQLLTYWASLYILILKQRREYLNKKYGTIPVLKCFEMPIIMFFISSLQSFY